MAELARALGLPAEASPREALAGGEPAVLLLDTFEAAGGLEDWLREQFVPALPARSLVVVAGRNAPGRAWRRDPGWGDLLRVVSLRNLEPDDARAFLRSAGVAEEHHGWMLELSHGHPLALSLLVDVLSQRQATAAGCGAVGVGGSARRGGAVGGELPGRGAESAPPAGAGMRGPRAADHVRPPGHRLRRSRGRGVVLVAAGPVVHGARTVRLVSARPRAGGHRRGSALARPGRLSGGARAGAPTRGQACRGERGSRARARGRRPDVPASSQPGGVDAVGLEEPRGGVRRRAAGRRCGRHRGHGRAPRGSGVGRDREALARAPARGVLRLSGRVDASCWAFVRRSLCTRPARTTSRAIPGHGRCGLTRSATRRLARGTMCSSPGS